MAVPKRRTSKMKKRQRRTHQKLSVPGINNCPDCGELKMSHRVCPSCGNYKGQSVEETE